MRIKLIYWMALLLGISGCYQSDTADLIIHNAQIYSCDESFTVYEAMAIRDGKIIQLGPEREILNGYQCSHVIDAALKPIFPGFHDGHAHFLGYARTLAQADLVGSNSFDEVLARLQKFAETCETEWIEGRGWDHTLWGTDEFPTNKELNRLFPDRPVLIRRVDGHAALANNKALEIAGITTETTIDGGWIEVKNDTLTGMLLDNAYDSVAQFIPPMDDAVKLSYLKQAEKKLFEAGLTSINDAGIDHEDRALFEEWYGTDELTIKSYAMLFPDDENMSYAASNGTQQIGNLHIGSFKLLADGALGSRGACLISPYNDLPKHFGFLLRDSSELYDIAQFAAEVGYQVNTHCIGDSANRVMLHIYEDLTQNNPDHRWKIEHAQVIHPADFEFFKRNYIIPSIQPTHCTSDMRWAEQRIGKDRIKTAYAYKTLLEHTGMVVLGTDFPVERIYPLESFYAAITRQDREGFPEEGFYPEECLSREEALRGMTIWPAFSNFEDQDKGTLEEGKAADFVILTKDIMRIPPAEILNTFVEQTYVDGELVFDAN
jgi:hypothetical protein